MEVTVPRQFRFECVPQKLNVARNGLISERRKSLPINKIIYGTEIYNPKKQATLPNDYFHQGVSDAGEIVYKFLNRENTYSHLLKSISDYEKRIDELKQQREILNDKLNLNQASTNNSQKTDAQLKLEIDEQTQLFLEVAEKAQNVELVEKRVWEWSLKNWRKIQKVFVKLYTLVNSIFNIYGDDKPFDQYVKDYPKTQDIPKVFKLIIKFVNENIRNLNQKELEQIIDENYAKKQFDDDYYKKNVRVTLDNKSSIINFSRTMSNESQIVSDRDEMDRSQNVFDQFDDNEDAEEIKQMEKEEATFIKEEQKQVKQTK